MPPVTSPSVLAVDLGTTGVRAAIIRLDGTTVDEAHVACAYDRPSEGWAEIDPRRWWVATKSVLAALFPTQDPRAIASIAVTGQAPTAALVTSDGTPTYPAILWLDTRAAEEASELHEPSYYLGPKLKWLARHQPDALRRAAVVAQSHSYIAHALTGAWSIDPSTAALSRPLWDPDARAWKKDMCASIGINPALLPRIVESHHILGHVTKTAAEQTGLAEGTPVVAGGGDFAASALGAGVTDPGEACLMLGTAGNLLLPTSHFGRSPSLIHSHHVGVPCALSIGGTLAGGALEWFRSTMAPHASFEELEAKASNVDLQKSELLFIPYLAGERTPIWNAHATGAFVGLRLEHDLAHLYRAVLESVALSFMHMAEIAKAEGHAVQNVVAANGAGKSALLRQLLSDALAAPLSYRPTGGGTLVGGAVLAALGSGLTSDPKAAAYWSRAMCEHSPRTEHTAIFSAKLKRRISIYESYESITTR